MRSLTFQTLTGQAIAPWLSSVAQLRISVFCEYPYLYQGSLDYEQHYLEAYASSPNCLFVLAFDGDQLVGAATGIPMVEADRSFQQPFLAQPAAQQWPLSQLFYFGESVLLPAYRGRGIGVRFFAEREAWAAQQGGIRWCCFCAIERAPDHPLRPVNYRSLEPFWRKRGYQHYHALRTELEWLELNAAQPSSHPMSFWIKAL